MPVPPLQITVLGSGTSVGVPTVACDCAVCHSEDPHDQRLRPSILIQYERRTIVVDTTPDFRTQALRARLMRLDAVLITHAHADHIMGLDDVRPFNYRQEGRIPIYGAADSLAVIERCFEYIFDPRMHSANVPKLELRALDGGPFDVFGVEFLPVPLMHGRASIYGFRFGNVAYLTDHSEIPESSMPLLEGLDVLFLDALRFRPHPTHSTVEQSLETVRRLAPKRAYFTHICHDIGHATLERELPAHIRLAYDGLVIAAGALE